MGLKPRKSSSPFSTPKERLKTACHIFNTSLSVTVVEIPDERERERESQEDAGTNRNNPDF